MTNSKVAKVSEFKFLASEKGLLNLILLKIRFLFSLKNELLILNR